MCSDNSSNNVNHAILSMWNSDNHAEYVYIVTSRYSETALPNMSSVESTETQENRKIREIDEKTYLKNLKNSNWNI